MRILACLLLISCLFVSSINAQPAPTTNPLTLETIFRTAVTVQPSIRAARLKLVEAQARLAETNAMRRPQLTFSGTVSGSHGNVADPFRIQTYGTVEGIVSMAIPNRGRLSALVLQAKGGNSAAEAGVQKARLDLAFLVSETFYTIHKARDARNIAEETLKQAQRQMEDTQKRVDAGDVPSADVLKTQVPLSQARVALNRVESGVRSAEQSLNILLNYPVDSAISLVPPTEMSPLSFTRDQAVDRAIAQSPEIRAAMANLNSTEAAIKLARRASDPDWAIEAAHARTTDITAYAGLTTIAITVTAPISDGGVVKRQVQQSEAQRDQAKSAMETVRQQVRRDILQAWEDTSQAEAALTGARETTRITELSLEKAQQAYAAGLTTTRDVLDALHEVAQARSDANTALYDLAVSRAKLYQTMGESPIK